MRIFDGETLLGTATVTAATRTWTFTTPALSPGSHSFTARIVDRAGNQGTPGTPFLVTVDPVPPTLAITSSSAALIAGQSATITFSFSETPIGFKAADISTLGGTISGLAVTVDPKIYTATFTPRPASSGTASITVLAGSYTDAAGNSGGAGTTTALSYDTRIAVELRHRWRQRRLRDQWPISW